MAAQHGYRRMRRLILIVVASLFVLNGCSSSNTAAPTSSPGVSGGGGRTCSGQPFTCEQLVALGLDYPYPRQPSSYLFVDGVAYPFVNLGHGPVADAAVEAGDASLTVRDLLQRLGLQDQADVPRTPVIAYGSNANVDALTRKFVTSGYSGPNVVPVIKASLQNFDVTWSPQFAFNGAMPATLVPSPGTTVSVWITWLDGPELAEMNATEGVGTLYSYGHLSGARLDAPGPPVAQPGLYVDCYGALKVGGRLLAVSGVPANHRRYKSVDSSGALREVGPAIGWHGSVFDLVLDNVRSPGDSAARTRSLARLSVQPREPGYSVIDGCVHG